MELTAYNTEQAARGYLMYALAIRGYKCLLADSRFPAEDMLVVSPSGRHFGIEVKGQSTKSFWRFTSRTPNPEIFFAFIYVSEKKVPQICVMDSKTTMDLWKNYKDKALARGTSENNQWGLNWTTPLEFQDRWDILPQ